MREHHAAFRDRLIDSERFSPELKRRYEREMKSMFEQNISPVRRISMIGIIIVLAVKIAVFSYAALAFNGLPLLSRLGFVAGILFSASFMAVMIRSLRKGLIHIRKDSNYIAVITWVFLVVMTVIIMLMAGDMEPVKGVKMLVNIMIFFMFGVVVLVKNTIEQGAMNTREKLLEVKYRIADLMEKIDNEANNVRR